MVTTSTFKSLFFRISPVLFFSLLLITNEASAQCGFAAGLGCPGTDYSNYGYNSTINAATLEYDNFTSGFHSTIIRNSDGKFQIWGEQAAPNGTGPLLVPTEINSTNFPGLTGTPIKAAMGSVAVDHQKVVLTTDGLFAWGARGALLATSIKNTTAFSKISIDGKADGLPHGVYPSDVKMMFATTKTLAIVTCDGSAYVITTGKQQMQGDGEGLHSNRWARVKVDAPGNPYLQNVIALRGSTQTLVALTSDNEVYTWGYRTISGIESVFNPIARKYATKMRLPESSPIKMIGVTSYDKTKDQGSKFYDEPTYYLLYANGKVYAMGNNDLKQLGDFTTTSSPSSATRKWVQSYYPSATNPEQPGILMEDVRWISPNEHDLRWPGITIINEQGRIWNWGSNAGSMLGRTSFGQDKNTGTAFFPGQPLSNAEFDPATSKVLAVETGGHTTLIIQECQENFGYVGHAIHGSTAAGQDGDTYYPRFIFNTATIQVCGTDANPEIGFAATPVSANNDEVLCKNQVLELTGSPAGGVFSVISGPGVLTNGNLLTFLENTTSGTVRVRYTVATSLCSNDFVERDIQFDVCTLFKIRGTVWIDENRNAIREAGEMGTNGTITGNDGLWANLLDATNRVVASVRVAVDGTYELSTIFNGTYSVQITNEKIGVGASIPTASGSLPAGWEYTGNNRSNSSVCLVPSCATPNRISGITVYFGDVDGLNFGIIGNQNISGTVFHDPNGLNGSPVAVDGWPVNTTGAGYRFNPLPQLYIAVVSANGRTSHYVPVSSNGTYQVSLPIQSVTFVLTSTLPVVGTVPVQTLPSNWVFVGENFGEGNGSGSGINDGSGTGANAPSTRQDGKVAVSFNGVTNTITRVDFGIEQRPVADPKIYVNVNPGEFKWPSDEQPAGFPKVDNHSSIEMINPNLGPLTGSDPEDCPPAQSCSSGRTFTVHTINSYTQLYYDFGGTVGVRKIDMAAGPVTITHFDPSKMVIYGQSGYGVTGSEFGFTYSLTDAAGVQSVPVIYSISTFGILPVAVVNFDAILRDGGVELLWTTSSEQSSKGFRVEKSPDARVWTVLADVPSKATHGYSDQPLNYQLHDSEKVSGTVYYRLKHVALDETFQIFGVRAIKTGDLPLSVYPNPATSIVHIVGLSKSGTLRLYDYNGRLVKLETTKGKTHLLDVSDLGNGVYNLVIVNENGSTQSFKLYKK